MNRILLALATLMACAGSAWAQDSLTLFGVVDLAGRAVKNDQTQYQIASGGLQTSRLGIRGTEDLGDGMSAGFWLEGELLPDTGNPNGFNWMRRSTVSLAVPGVGELRAGRDKVPTLYEWEDFDPFRDAGVGRSTRLSLGSGLVPSGAAYNTFSRASNSVGYLLPGNLGGLFGQAMVAAGENSPGSKYMGARLGYRAGDLVASASYGTTEVTASIDAKIWNLGGTYDFKLIRLWGFYSSLEIGAASQDNWLLGLTVPMGLMEWRASYQSMDGGGTFSGREASMVAIGGVYSLSRRTALYGTYSRISNSGTTFTVASGSPLTVGNDSSGYEVGIRHSF